MATAICVALAGCTSAGTGSATGAGSATGTNSATGTGSAPAGSGSATSAGSVPLDSAVPSPVAGESAPAAASGSATSESTTSDSATPAAPDPATGVAVLDPAAREVVTGLAVPWGLGFLPDGAAVLTQRNDARVLLERDGEVREVGVVQGVVAGGEGGLLGLAVSPTFAEDATVFVYYTGADDNRIDRLTLSGPSGAETVADQQSVLTGIPKAGIHNGGRLRFGPDGLLYVGTGDASDRPAAQDLGSLGGKILRLAPDGSAPADNPFPEAPLVFSLGHRNVQGLAFDPQGRLWATEFGQNTWDELNLIERGGNYGWPDVEGPGSDGADASFRAPARAWPTDDASPSGLAVLGGSAWMAGLAGERLWQIPLTPDGTGEPVEHLAGEWGRLRTVEPAPDGTLWVTTSNTDGRGDVRDGDDRILSLRLG